MKIKNCGDLIAFLCNLTIEYGAMENYRKTHQHIKMEVLKNFKVHTSNQTSESSVR